MVALSSISAKLEENEIVDCSPSNKTPVLLNSSAEGDLLSDLSAGGASQLQSCSIGLDSNDLGTSGCGSNIDHEDLILCQLSNLGLLSIGSLDTEQATQQEVVDFDLGVNSGKLSTKTEDETDQTIGTAKSWVDAGSNT